MKNSNRRVEIVREQPTYKHIAEQLLDVRAMTLDKSGAPKARERYQRVVNAAIGLSTGTDETGGYLVESNHSEGVYETAIETGIFSSRCTRQPIGADSDSYNYQTAEDRDRSDALINGIAVYRRSEAEEMESTGKAILDDHEVRLLGMYGLAYVSNRMLRDAAAMSAYVKRNIIKQFSFKLDHEVYQGTGVGQCLGIKNSDLSITVEKEPGQTADSIIADNIVNMFARFHGDINKAAWFINKNTLPSLPLVTTTGFPLYTSGSLPDAPFGSILGCPIVPAEHCQTLGNKGDIILGDFSEYLIIDKGGTEITPSMHVKFLTDEMAFRFIVRNNGQPVTDTPITPLKGADTLSPFIMLENRS